jgi:hypothetical protein
MTTRPAPADRFDPRQRALEIALAAGIGIFAVYCLSKFQFATLFSYNDRQGDFQMWYLLPPQIKQFKYPSVLTHNWTIPFPYLPSAVSMMLPLSLLPRPVAFALWIVMQCGSLTVILCAGSAAVRIGAIPIPDARCRH